MDAFNLDETVINHYKAFAGSFTKIRSHELKAKVDELYATDLPPESVQPSIQQLGLVPPD